MDYGVEYEMLKNYIEESINKYGAYYWESIKILRDTLIQLEMEYESKEE